MTRAARDAGFTLIEMLVVLAILGLVSGIVFPAVDTALRRQGFIDAATRLELALRTARADAVREGRPVRLDAAPDGHGFLYDGTGERFDAATAITLPDGGIRFFADGSAIGGAIVLRDRRTTRRWVIRPATGAIAALR